MSRIYVAEEDIEQLAADVMRITKMTMRELRTQRITLTPRATDELARVLTKLIIDQLLDRTPSFKTN